MYRIQQAQLVPALGFSADTTSFLPKWQMGDVGLCAPKMVNDMISAVDWEWLQDVSGRIARQYRRLDVGLGKWVKDLKTQPILMGNESPLSPLAGAHAWLMALAQQASMDIRDAELEVLAGEKKRGIMELSGVATLAGCPDGRGSGRNLTTLLQALATALVRSIKETSGGGEKMVQFLHRRSLQMKSPIDENKALPMAAFVVRFSGITPEGMMKALVRSLGEIGKMTSKELTDCSLVINPACR